MDWMFYPGLNNPTRANEVCEESGNHFREHADLRKRVEDHLRARYEINDLVPQSLASLGSGHYFPFSESYNELEGSLILAVFGFYRHAFVALRTSMELSLVGVFYDRDDDSASEIEQWIRSGERTPNFKKMIKALSSIRGYAAFCRASNFQEILLHNYDNLGGFVHVRGYSYSSTRLWSSGVIGFSKDSLHGYIESFCEVAHSSVILMLLKYPIGMQALPLFAKFGLDSPAGGFLDVEARAAVLNILTEQEHTVLLAISNTDPDVRQVVESIEAMPDLTTEQVDQQSREWKNWKKTQQMLTEDNT